MGNATALRQGLRALLDAEQGTLFRDAPFRVTMLYPSPYRTAMSSLGYQVMYRVLNERPDVSAERACLPEDPEAWRRARQPLLTIESQRHAGQCDLVAISLAWELEITGLIESLELCGIRPVAAERDARAPLVVLGGPLTFSNPVPAGVFADVIVMGEGEDVIHVIVDAMQDEPDRGALLARLSHVPGLWVPAVHGERLLPTVAAENAKLPAYGQIITPNTELANMHLVEAERGCHRKCTFCVMRRSTNGGMRLAEPDAIVESIPAHARRVGLVGAAVSDHPKLVPILTRIVDSGREVGLSSLRADRLNPELMELLRRGGYRTLTVASDGASERLRQQMLKQIREEHLHQAAVYAAEYRMRVLKLYMMIGVPGETDADIDELIRFSLELSRIGPLALGIAPFVSKRNTPLDRRPYAGIKEIERTMQRLQKELRGRVDVRSVSSRWSWVEWCLAQGGFDMGRAAVDAHRGGSTFAAWKEAIRVHRVDAQPEDAQLRLGRSAHVFSREQVALP